VRTLLVWSKLRWSELRWSEMRWSKLVWTVLVWTLQMRMWAELVLAVLEVRRSAGRKTMRVLAMWVMFHGSSGTLSER
jgi:hypothetical protein